MSIQIRSLVLFITLGALWGTTLVGCQTSKGARFGAKQESILPFDTVMPGSTAQYSDSAAQPQSLAESQDQSVKRVALGPAPPIHSISTAGKTSSAGHCPSCH